MTALLNYIYSSFKRDKNKNVFISDPPGPAILLWTNNQTHPNLTGISVVKELNLDYQNQNQHISHNLITTIANEIKTNTSIPFLEIEYDFLNDILIINGTRYNVSNGGNIIANTFNLTISNTPTKAVNNSQSVTDMFHIWSRSFFSGTAVRKIDTDLVVVDIIDNTLSSFVEIKRSDRVNFNSWQPFSNDLSNYEMMFALSDALNIPFYTIHHNDVNNKIIDANKLVNVFTYDPNSPVNWGTFRSLQNRQQLTAQDIVNSL
ncbi:hypothetical protein ACQKMV_07930 [Lysinibacillus sp. NPDC094403]|uniref:hypothetical protein n=1 Tax=Lysinibacillus sp. NPDC094403 TaxID=3390581 RepID=UPI003CFF9960